MQRIHARKQALLAHTHCIRAQLRYYYIGGGAKHTCCALFASKDVPLTADDHEDVMPRPRGRRPRRKSRSGADHMMIGHLQSEPFIYASCTVTLSTTTAPRTARGHLPGSKQVERDTSVDAREGFQGVSSRARAVWCNILCRAPWRGIARSYHPSGSSGPFESAFQTGTIVTGAMQ